MGTYSKFLRTSGSRAFINLEKWKLMSQKNNESFILKIEDLAHSSTKHLEQISKQDLKILMLLCYIIPKDILCLIASFLPICFVSIDLSRPPAILTRVNHSACGLGR